MSFTHCDYCNQPWVGHGTACLPGVHTSITSLPCPTCTAMKAQAENEIRALRARAASDAALIERLKKALRALLHCDYKKCPDVDCIDSRKKARAAIKEAEGRKG